MNLQEVAQAEQSIRGKLNRHVAGKAVAEKEVAMHDGEITACLTQLADLKEHAAAALDACARLAVVETGQTVNAPVLPPEAAHEPILASNAA